MARLGAVRRLLAFDGRPSPLRSWDIRFRVAAVGLVSAALVGAPALSLVPLTLGVALLLGLARARVDETFRVVVALAPFLVYFFVLGVLFEPTWAQAGFLAVQGGRFLLLLLLGQVLYLTATPTDVAGGIRWYLGWLGRRRAWAAASMAGWALGSVPAVLDQAAALLDAAALRGLTARRHPIRLLKLLTLGLLVRTLGRSTDLAGALEARGFGQAVPPSDLRARPRDALGLALTLAGVVGAWVLGSILGG